VDAGFGCCGAALIDWHDERIDEESFA